MIKGNTDTNINHHIVSYYDYNDDYYYDYCVYLIL